MPAISNIVFGIINIFSLFFAIGILLTGISMKHEVECYNQLSKPMILTGALFILFSVIGIIGACCRVSFFLLIYLVALFIILVLSTVYSIYSIMVSNKGMTVMIIDGYKEYKLPDNPNWFEKRAIEHDNWKGIKSCLTLPKHNMCADLKEKQSNNGKQLDPNGLRPLQSGCCKPPYECGFSYEGTTNWKKVDGGGGSNNDDCKAWDNNNQTLCFDCKSCQAAFLYRARAVRNKASIIQIVFLICLYVLFNIGTCAYSNT